MKPLLDTDPMPFGQYRGKSMSDVPASYFHWLWTKQGMEHDTVSPVADYIRRSLSALQQEFHDGIW
jgi:hypothetical protein